MIMPFKKGDIVFVDFEMPGTGGFKEHPGVVLSGLDVYENDRCYLFAMMTSNNTADKFTFRLDNSMLEKPSDAIKSQVRCNLITYVLEKHIRERKPANRLKPLAFERLIAYINEVVCEV